MSRGYLVMYNLIANIGFKSNFFVVSFLIFNEYQQGMCRILY